MTTETIPETTVPLEPTRERTARDVLLGAARYIEEHGWGAARGGACAWVAMCEVTNRDTDWTARSQAEDALAALVGGDSSSSIVNIWGYNDDPDRTEAEVLAALRAAADTAP